MVKSGIAGFSARCITVTVLMPFTVLKTRLEVSKYKHTKYFTAYNIHHNSLKQMKYVNVKFHYLVYIYFVLS